MRILVPFLLATAPFFAFSQGQTLNWYFGEGVGMDFSNGEPVGFVGGEVYGNPQQDSEYLYSEGVAVISDDEGNLMFYSNGEKVWNSSHEVMPNGSDLMGMYSSTNAAFIVPQPNVDSLFYLFTTDGAERLLSNGLRYSKISMCRDGGMGDVIPEEKNILLLDTASEKLAAAYHSNGSDVWLVAHKFFDDAFYAYRITEQGITDVVVSNVGSVHVGNPNFLNGCGGAVGQMKISPDGSRLALIIPNANPVKVELFDFDMNTGIVSDFVALQPYGDQMSSGFMYGVEFSPDNSKLYINGLNGLLQFNLAAGNDSISINNSKQTIPLGYFCSMGTLQLAPDNKIYVGRCSTSVAVINEPNNLGLACNADNQAVTFGANSAKGSFPSFISGLNYSNRKPECSVVTNAEENDPIQWNVYPNPAKSQLNVVHAMDGWCFVELYDAAGKLVIHQQENRSQFSLDVSSLSGGCYTLRVFNGETSVKSLVLIE